MKMLKRKKKEEPTNVELSTGFYLAFPEERTQGRAFSFCVPKGLMVFFLVFGAFGGFMSAMEITYQSVLVGIVFLLGALFFSGLYTFEKTRYRDVGYIIFFIFYIFLLNLFKAYVNSGFAALVNEIRHRAEVYFDVSATEEFHEQIENRTWTITIMMIFVGLFLILVLNIFVSNYMSLKFAIFLTMGIYIVPGYLRMEPSLPYVVCILLGLGGIVIFKNSGHFEKGKRTFSLVKEKKKNGVHLTYGQSKNAYVGAFFALAITVLLVVVSSFVYTQNVNQTTYVENPYKEKTKETMGLVVGYGLRALLPGGVSSPGMNRGNLVYSAAIRRSDKTCMEVTLAPYSTEPIYLKAYTGLYYEDAQWADGYEIMGLQPNDVEYFAIEEMKDEAEQLKKAYKKGKGEKARIDITNICVPPSLAYVPYYTVFDNYTYYVQGDAITPVGKTATYEYYPNLHYEQKIVPEKMSFLYYKVGDRNKPVIARWLKEAGIQQGDADAVKKVAEHLMKDYKYSLNPGRVPDGEDFLNYFLEENKKGVCAHFATAATLIYRQLGIPARYVEGYVVDYNKVLKGKVQENLKYEEYFDGKSDLGKTAVMKVEVPESNAHAWVEIYQRGKGWIVVDPTPPQFDSEEENDFWNSLSKFMSTSSELSLGDGISGEVVESVVQKIGKWGALLCLIILLLATIVRRLVPQIQWWLGWHGKSPEKNLLYYYGTLVERVKKQGSTDVEMAVPKQAFQFFAKRYEERTGESINAEEMWQRFERICYGPEEGTREQVEPILTFLKKVRKKV